MNSSYSCIFGSKTHEKKECSKTKAKNERAVKVCIIHDALVNLSEGVEDGHRLLPDMREVDSELYKSMSLYNRKGYRFGVRTFEQRRFTLNTACPKSRPPGPDRLNITPISISYPL